jgi:hypothetical protein
LIAGIQNFASNAAGILPAGVLRLAGAAPYLSIVGPIEPLPALAARHSEAV